MLRNFLNIFAFNSTPPPQISSLNTVLEPLSANGNSLKSLFSFVFSRYIYVFSFGLLHAFFVGYGIADANVFQKELEYIITPSLLLVAVFVLISPYNKYLEIFFYFIANFWATINIFQAIYFQTRFDVPSMYIMLNTTKTEASGFFTYFGNIKAISILFIIWFIPFILLKICNKYQYTWNYKTRFIPLLLSLILLLYPSYTHRTFQEQVNAGIFIKLSNIDKNIRKAFWVENFTFIPKALKIVSFASSVPDNVLAKYEGAQNVVLFITESTNRNQMSIYGYGRETTPKLAKSNIIKYDDVISPSPITYHSLPHMLTFADIKKPDNYITTIHDLFNGAGFDTYGYNGYADINTNDFVYILQARAESFRLGGENLDADVIEDALNVMKNNKDKKNFILIFTAAFHYPYNRFFPSDFTQFEGSPPNLFKSANIERRNDYDRLMLYMDTMITDFFDEIEEIGNTVVLVTSDHGEEVGNYSTVFGHSARAKHLSNFEIPFYVYFTKDYKKKPDLVFETTRKYQNDNLIHSIIDLANLETPLFDPKRSIFNKEFREVQRFMHEEDYEIMRDKFKKQ